MWRRFADALWSWALLVVAVFAVVDACSLTFVYVEGDDALTVAYHALGRNRSLQLPFNPYQSGMDLLLSVLPAKEPVLRVAAMSLTAVATVLATVLLLTLVLSWLELTEPRRQLLVAATLLAAVPELFYLGLVYEPPMVALACVLGAHLLVRGPGGGVELRAGWGGAVRFVTTGALFGLGVGCRWDVAFYGWVVLVESLLARDGRPLWRRLATVAAWGGVGTAVWVAMVGLSGYPLASVLGPLGYAGAVAANPVMNPVVWAGSYLSLLTPGFVALAIWGLLVLWRDDRRRLAFVLAAVAPVVLFLAWNVPKGILAFLVPMAVLPAAGAGDLWFGGRRMAPELRAGMATALLLPWLVGVRVTFGDKAWGPGFELRPYDRPPAAGRTFAPTLGAGAAIPTQEGERPAFGHAAVLLGGGWREHVRAMSEERHQAIRTALELDLPIYCMQFGWQFIEAELLGLGFTTSEPSSRISGGAFPSVRHFTDAGGRRAAVFGSGSFDERLLSDPAEARRLEDALGVDRVVGYACDSSVARLVYRSAPEAMSPIGPMSAVLDLGRLAARPVRTAGLAP